MPAVAATGEPGAKRDRRSGSLLHQIEQEQISRLTAGKEIPDFAPGDTLVVNVKVHEGDRTIVQAYEGKWFARAGSGINQSLPACKISYGEGV